MSINPIADNHNELMANVRDLLSPIQHIEEPLNQVPANAAMLYQSFETLKPIVKEFHHANMSGLLQLLNATNNEALASAKETMLTMQRLHRDQQSKINQHCERKKSLLKLLKQVDKDIKTHERRRNAAAILMSEFNNTVNPLKMVK